MAKNKVKKCKTIHCYAPEEASCPFLEVGYPISCLLIGELDPTDEELAKEAVRCRMDSRDLDLLESYIIGLKAIRKDLKGA